MKLCSMVYRYPSPRKEANEFLTCIFAFLSIESVNGKELFSIHLVFNFKSLYPQLFKRTHESLTMYFYVKGHVRRCFSSASANNSAKK